MPEAQEESSKSRACHRVLSSESVWLNRHSCVTPKTGRVVIIGAGPAGLTAAQLLPFLELLRLSHRDTSFATGAWAMPAWGWANFLVPAFRMLRSGSGLLYQPDQFWTSSTYVPLGVKIGRAHV